MEISNFTQLIVWQRAMDLVEEVYHVTRKYPRDERFGLTAQTHRSAISIPSNVAEGFKRQRRSLSVYVNHLDIAAGSEGELLTQLELARRLGYVSASDLKVCFELLNQVGRMLFGLRKSVDAIRRRQALRRP